MPKKGSWDCSHWILYHKCQLKFPTLLMANSIPGSKKVIQASILPRSLRNASRNLAFQTGYVSPMISFLFLNVISQILGQACDNASNNDTMLAELEFLIPNGVYGIHTRICCICHIINLVVKVPFQLGVTPFRFCWHLLIQGDPFPVHT